MQLFGISNDDFKKEWRIRQARRMNGNYATYHNGGSDELEGHVKRA